MLVLTRKVNEAIIIDDCIRVTIVSINGPNVRLGIEAPPDIRVDREEVHRRLREFCAADAVEQSKRAIERSTRGAYQAVVAGISEVEARRLALVSAQSAYDASQVGLEVGTRTVLDVLNNQRTLFSAQQAYAQAKYNFLQNRLLLEQAAGTLQVSDLEDVNRLLTTDESVARAIGAQ